MKKIMRKTGRILVVIVIILIGLLAISTVSNAILTGAEKKQYPPPGVLVTVHGEKMHVYAKGTGDKKIVLLSGFGTSCPALDFKYLMDGLSTRYTVIVVEYFGYGWSSTTDAPRTVANIVEETRDALKLAGFAPPYVLMPHSISGIYTLYYAATYPLEVEAIIGMESSVPAQLPVVEENKKRNVGTYPPASQGSAFWEFFRYSGLRRIALLLAPERLGVPQMDSYSAADNALLKTMFLWNYGNPNLIDELDHFLENLLAVQHMEIPSNIPAAFILADTTVEVSRAMPGFDWTKVHEDQLVGNVYGKVIILSGEHFIFYDHVDEIEMIVEDVLRSE
jgi:pimeloyl-ACP methyl ester carboxylesterase